MERLLRLGLAIGTAAVFVACDVLSASWGRSGEHSSLLLLVLVLLAPMGYVLFGVLNQSSTLSMNSGVVNTSMAVGTILVGVLAWHDPLTPRQAIGLTLAILSVALLTV